jgi:hypothetical protein
MVSLTTVLVSQSEKRRNIVPLGKIAQEKIKKGLVMVLSKNFPGEAEEDNEKS